MEGHTQQMLSKGHSSAGSTECRYPPPPPLGLSWAVMGGEQHLIPPLAMDGNTTALWVLRAVPRPRVSAGMGHHHLSGHTVPVHPRPFSSYAV